MNNKGQSLAVLIIIIPVLLVLMAFLIDNLLIGYEKMHLNSVTKEIIRENINDKSEERIKADFQKNGIDDALVIKTDNGLEISFVHDLESFFGKLISKDKYEIKIDIKGNLDNNKIKYEKGQA